jgi:glycosyltransferase involved in cell wall biosynthesis
VENNGRLEILYIVAAGQPWKFLEWVCRELHGRNCNLTFLLLNKEDPPLAPWLRSAGIPYEHVPYTGKLDLPAAISRIYRFCRRRRFDLVHTHFMNACLAGLAGSRLAGVKTRVHTRHHGSPHPYSDRKPWELCYDDFNNRLSTHVVAPCEDVRRRLLEEGVDPRKVRLIHHGYDIAAFADVPEERVRRLREKYRIPAGEPVIGSMSRYIRLKGVEHMIEAFARLLETYPRACLVLANARGANSVAVRSRIAKLPPGRCIQIGFEADVFALYRLFDIFVNVPVGARVEGFGQTYVEALAAGVPSIFTMAGVAHEFIVHGENALVVDYENPEAIHVAMRALLESRELRERLIQHGRRSVEQRFGLKAHTARLDELYLSLTNGRP